MGPTAKTITILYLIFTIGAVVIAIAVWRSTRGERKELDEKKAAHMEKGWLAIMAAFLFTAFLATIFLIPYGESKGAETQVVKVTARQFSFQFEPPSVKAGTQVKFELVSEDTTHGFGVEYPTGGIAFQAQVVPQNTQSVYWTFKEAGSYPVICMEYCGVGHHVMLSKLEVTA